jgi:hypothetical protein
MFQDFFKALFFDELRNKKYFAQLKIESAVSLLLFSVWPFSTEVFEIRITLLLFFYECTDVSLLRS